MDHPTLVYIVQSKSKPPLTRMLKLIELTQLHFHKGKEMVICDMLCCMCAPNNDDPLGDATPVIDKCRVNMAEESSGRRATCSMAKDHNISVPPASTKNMDCSTPGASSKATRPLHCLCLAAPILICVYK